MSVNQFFYFSKSQFIVKILDFKVNFLGFRQNVGVLR